MKSWASKCQECMQGLTEHTRGKITFLHHLHLKVHVQQVSTMTANSSASVSSGSHGSGQEELVAQALQNNMYEVNAELWVAGISKNCARHNFNFIQFLNSPDLEAVGSVWQKLVCKQVNVPQDVAEKFWKEKGRAAARKAISRRRSNTSNAMKKKFKGKEE